MPPACHWAAQIHSIMSFNLFATHVFAVLNAKSCYRWIISWDILFQSVKPLIFYTTSRNLIGTVVIKVK